MTPSVGSPGANRFPSSASSPVSAASAASTLSGEDSSSVRTPWLRSTAVRHAYFFVPLGASHPASTTALACGKTSSALPFGLPAAYVGNPASAAWANTSNPTCIHPKKRLRSPCSLLGVLNDWMLSEASSRSVRRDRPDAAHFGGESIAMTSGRRSRIRRPLGTRHVRGHLQRHQAFVQEHQIESFADPDVDPQGPHRPRSLDLATVGQEVQQVAPGQHAEHLARLGDQDGRPVLHLGERRLDRAGPTPRRGSVGPSLRRRRPAARRDRGRPAPAARGRGSTRRTPSRRHLLAHDRRLGDGARAGRRRLAGPSHGHRR